MKNFQLKWDNDLTGIMACVFTWEIPLMGLLNCNFGPASWSMPFPIYWHYGMAVFNIILIIWWICSQFVKDNTVEQSIEKQSPLPNDNSTKEGWRPGYLLSAVLETLYGFFVVIPFILFVIWGIFYAASIPLRWIWGNEQYAGLPKQVAAISWFMMLGIWVLGMIESIAKDWRE